MTLDEAIEHCKEVATSRCDQCAKEHYELMKLLIELKELRKAKMETKRENYYILLLLVATILISVVMLL